MRHRFRIIANPISGRGRGARLARRVRDRLERTGSRPELCETREAGDATRLASHAQGVDAVVCLGGDGTINEALNGISGATPLAMIPCGTANVLAKELRLPKDPDGLARVLCRGDEIRWDAGIDRITGRRFLLFHSAGYDAHVVHIFHAARRGSIHMWQYVVWGLLSIGRYPLPRITVEIDGRTVATDASWVQVSNVSAYGGPLRFTPAARPDDGLFEVMIFRSPWRRDIVRMFARAIAQRLFGCDFRPPDLLFLPARRVRMTPTDPARPVPAQIDGDPAGHLPAELEILPGSVRLLKEEDYRP